MSRDLMSLPNPYGWERLTLAGYKRTIVARLSGENSSTFLHRVLREGIVQVQDQCLIPGELFSEELPIADGWARLLGADIPNV